MSNVPMGDFKPLADDLSLKGTEAEEESAECDMCHKANGPTKGIEMEDGEMRVCAHCASMMGEGEGEVDDLA